MRLLFHIALSLAILGLCVWLVWPDERALQGLKQALSSRQLAQLWPSLGGFLVLLAVTHWCRAWRWNHLLEPIDARLPPGRLLAISSVGFMFILALPARLGEFVRPALIRERGRVSASAALGTVAVERVVDGLLVSVFVAAAFLAHRDHPHAEAWMMPVAYAALALFAGALLFLACALRWPDESVRFSARLTLTPYFAPRVAQMLEQKLRSLISGFLVLRDPRNLSRFVLWSSLYWGANGLGMWVLARGFGLALPVIGAYATMALVAVGISMPNAPALMGQYQWLVVQGLALYVGRDIAGGTGLAYAIVLWGVQVTWYLGAGALALATPYVSLADVFGARARARSAPPAADPFTPSSPSPSGGSHDR